MIRGVFVDSNKPTVPATIAWGEAVQTPHFILDTGFTGDLVVTQQMATDLGLQVDGVSSLKAAGHDVHTYPTATAIAVMEGSQLYVRIYLLARAFLEPHGFWQEVFLAGAGIYILGASQIFFLIAGIVATIGILNSMR